jgi:hypothetical protein
LKKTFVELVALTQIEYGEVNYISVFFLYLHFAAI